MNMTSVKNDGDFFKVGKLYGLRNKKEMEKYLRSSGKGMWRNKVLSGENVVYFDKINSFSDEFPHSFSYSECLSNIFFTPTPGEFFIFLSCCQINNGQLTPIETPGIDDDLNRYVIKFLYREHLVITRVTGFRIPILFVEAKT